MQHTLLMISSQAPADLQVQVHPRERSPYDYFM